MALIYTLILCLRKFLMRCFNFVLSDILIKCTARSGYVFVHFGVMPAVSAGLSRSALLYFAWFSSQTSCYILLSLVHQFFNILKF